MLAHDLRHGSERLEASDGTAAKSCRGPVRGEVVSLAEERDRRAWALRTACEERRVSLAVLADVLGLSKTQARRVLTGEAWLTPELVGKLEARPALADRYRHWLPRYVRPMVQLGLFGGGS